MIARWFDRSHSWASPSHPVRAGKARDILERNGFKVINGGGYEAVLKIVENNQSAAE